MLTNGYKIVGKHRLIGYGKGKVINHGIIKRGKDRKKRKTH